MATPLSFARDDLRLTKDIYDQASLAYDQIRAKTDTLAKKTKDEFNAVPAISESFLVAYEAPSDDFSSLFISTLSEFSGETRSDETDVASLLVDLDSYMRAQSPRLAIKSRGTIIDPAVDGGANAGDQTLIINSFNADGTIGESANVDDVRYDILRRGSSLAQLGLDSWEVRGTVRNDFSEFDGPGAGVENSQMSSIGPGRTNFFTNSSFDQSLRTGGAGADKVPGIKITSGDANVSLTRNDVAENRGGNPGALEITGACTLEIDFLALGISLSEIRPFVMGMRAETTGNADFTMTLGSSGAAAPMTGTFNIVGAQAWQNYIVNADTKNGWREVFDETGRPLLIIDVTSVAAILRLDDLILDTLPIVGGLPSGIVSGLTAPGNNDFHESLRRLTVASGTCTFSGGAAGDTIDSVTVDGVELLREPVVFITDLATTVALVVDQILGVPTAPDYDGSNIAGVLTVLQRKPLAGTPVLVSTVTDNGGGLASVDVNLTGGVIGEIADMMARHVGFVVSHDVAASTGWEDN